MDNAVNAEIATFEWVSCWNEARLDQSLGYRTSAEIESDYWKQNTSQGLMEPKAEA
ncbi:transposase [Corynebacterium sp. HMSC068G04]|nr:transposase [Corynebacterium sp. HMSC068G04]